jgi:glycosyltransferase involved in cell wall biosynthesis
MTSNIKYPFLNSFIQNLRLSFSYAGGYALIFIPIDLLLTVLVLAIGLGLFPLIGIFAITLSIVVGVVVFSLRLCLFAGVLPYMLMEGEKSFIKALKKSIPMIKKNFKSYFRNITLAMIIYISITTTCFLPTMGLVPIIGIATLTIFTRILELSYYFRYKKAKYYIDFITVVDTAPFGERPELIVKR